MNEGFREWYLTVCPSLQDGQLEKRQAGIERYCEKATPEDIIFLVKMCFGMDVEKTYFKRFKDAFIQEDASFPAKSNVELTLLAGATLVEIVEHDTVLDHFTELLCLCTTFSQNFKCPKEIMDTIQNQFDEDRCSLREYDESPSAHQVSLENVDTLKKQLEENEMSWDIDMQGQLSCAFDSLVKYIKTLDNQISKLELTQKIYKEDSQILWWMNAEWSELLGRPLKEIKKVEGSMVIGYEAARLVTNFPGPYSMEGILSKLITACSCSADKVSFPNYIMEVSPSCFDKITEDMKGSSLLAHFPICNAILASNYAKKEDEWYPKFKAEFISVEDDSFTIQQYAWQVYLECLTQRAFAELQLKQGGTP